MRITIVLFMYGMVALTGYFLSVFWSITTYKRLHRIPRPEWKNDKYLLLAMAFALVSIGNSIEYTGRVWGNYVLGLSPILRGFEFYPIMAGLAIVLIGSTVMVRMADLEFSTESFWLKIMGTITVIWAAIILFHVHV